MEYCNSGQSSADRRNGLEMLCERYRGQPIECLTSDGVRYCGIELMVCGDGVEIIDKCNRIIFIPFRHIDAVVEPKMTLNPFCGRSSCKCNSGDCECGGDGDGDYQTPAPLKDRWDD